MKNMNAVHTIEETKISFLKNILLICGGVAFMMALSQIRIYWPNPLVPQTGQTLGAFIIGLSYGAKRSFSTMFMYLGMTMTFSFGPTTGYLIGMLIAATMLGYFSDRGFGKKSIQIALLVFMAQLVIYSFGVLVLSNFVGFKMALGQGIIPFIPGAIMKMILCLFMLPVARKIVK